MNTIPSTTARPPHNRLALVSLVAALYAPVVVRPAVLLFQLALAPMARGCLPSAEPFSCPAPTATNQLLALYQGLVLLAIPAVGVALASGHIALSRMRHQSATKDRRTVALWGLILRYSTVLVVALWWWLSAWNGE